MQLNKLKQTIITNGRTVKICSNNNYIVAYQIDTY